MTKIFDIDGNVLYTAPDDCSIRAAVRDAVYGDVSLRRADLRGADLHDLYMPDRADLREADFRKADLTGADFDFCGDLRGADFRGANLTNTNLVKAKLDGAKFDVPTATKEEAIQNLDRIREIIIEEPLRLVMSHWHEDNGWMKRTCAQEASCGTTHCMAGWLQVCAPKAYHKLPAAVAGYLRAPVAADKFYETDDAALRWLKERRYAK